MWNDLYRLCWTAKAKALHPGEFRRVSKSSLSMIVECEFNSNSAIAVSQSGHES